MSGSKLDSTYRDADDTRRGPYSASRVPCGPVAAIHHNRSIGSCQQAPVPDLHLDRLFDMTDMPTNGSSLTLTNFLIFRHTER